MALAFCSGSSHAAIANVKSIVIENALTNYLQVSEVVAISAGIDQALAATATATGTGDWPLTSPDYAIDGVAPDAYPAIYHSDGPGPGEALTITFNDAIELEALSIFGRAESSFFRDVYDVFIYDAAGALLASFFDQDATEPGVHRVDVPIGSVSPVVPVPAAGVLFAGAASLAAARRTTRKTSRAPSTA